MTITAANIKLANGIMMPKLGVGTWKMTNEDVLKAIPIALSMGYRLIDTATYYRNEEAVGEVVNDFIQSGRLKRSELFIESKLATFDQGYESCLKAVQASLNRLGLEYIDLYLIHWPGCSKLSPDDPKNAELRRGSWQALEQLLREGKVKAIGVSNYLERHLEEMRSYASVLPHVNQFELHPCYYPEETIEWCQRNSVVIQAYSSLARGRFLEPEFLQKHDFVQKVSDRHNKTIAQVVLRWAWQHEFAIIPKSVTPARIAENADLDFDLTDDEMAALDGLCRSDPFKVCWDPKSVF